MDGCTATRDERERSFDRQSKDTRGATGLRAPHDEASRLESMLFIAAIGETRAVNNDRRDG